LTLLRLKQGILQKKQQDSSKPDLSAQEFEGPCVDTLDTSTLTREPLDKLTIKARINQVEARFPEWGLSDDFKKLNILYESLPKEIWETHLEQKIDHLLESDEDASPSLSKPSTSQRAMALVGDKSNVPNKLALEGIRRREKFKL
jgi:hypothetical protein